MRSSVKILLLLIGLRPKDKGMAHSKEIQTSQNPYCVLLALCSPKLRRKVGKTIFKDTSPSFVTRIGKHHRTHLCVWRAVPPRPTCTWCTVPPPVSPMHAMLCPLQCGKAGREGLMYMNLKGEKRRAFVSHVILLTLNQGLSESMICPQD